MQTPVHPTRNNSKVIFHTILFVLALSAIRIGAQVDAVGTPKITKITPEQGAAPGETIHVQGTNLVNDPSGNTPPVVTVTAPDTAHPGQTKSVEISASGSAEELTVVLPQNALAGPIAVQYGPGENAVRSESVLYSIRPASFRLFTDSFYETLPQHVFEKPFVMFDRQNRVSIAVRRKQVPYEYYQSYRFDGSMAGCRTSTAWCGTGSPSCEGYPEMYTPQISRETNTLITGLPNGTRQETNFTCPYQDDLAYLVYHPSGTRLRCGNPTVFVQPRRLAVEYKLLESGALQEIGAVNPDMVYTAKGERLEFSGNTLQLWVKDEFGNETPRPVISTSPSTYYGQLWQGPGGHVFFSATGFYGVGGRIYRINADGTYKDTLNAPGVEYGMRNPVMDCQGNIFLPLAYTRTETFGNAPFPEQWYETTLYKLPFTGTQWQVVDPSVNRAIPRDGIHATYANLAGVTPYGDLYFSLIWPDLPARAMNQQCNDNHQALSTRDAGVALFRHPTLRGETCRNEVQYELVGTPPADTVTESASNTTGSDHQLLMTVVDYSQLEVPSVLDSNNGSSPNSEFCPILTKMPNDSYPLGYMGDFAFRLIYGPTQIPPCALKLQEVKVLGGDGCRVTGDVELPDGSGKKDEDIPLNDSCVVIFGAEACAGTSNCQIWKPSAGQLNPIIWAVHTGRFRAEFKYIWPTQAGPAPAECVQSNNQIICNHVMPAEVKFGSLGSVHNQYDGIINRYANLRAIPPHYIKGHASKETACPGGDCFKAETFRWEPYRNIRDYSRRLIDDDVRPFNLEGQSDRGFNTLVPDASCTPANSSIYTYRGSKLATDGSDVAFRNRYKAYRYVPPPPDWSGPVNVCHSLTGFDLCNVTIEEIFIASNGGASLTGTAACNRCTYEGYQCCRRGEDGCRKPCPHYQSTFCGHTSVRQNWHLYSPWCNTENKRDSDPRCKYCAYDDVSCYVRQLGEGTELMTAETTTSSSYGLYNFMFADAMEVWSWYKKAPAKRELKQLTEPEYSTNLESFNIQRLMRKYNMCSGLNLSYFSTTATNETTFNNNCWSRLFKYWNGGEAGYGAGVIEASRPFRPRL